MTADEWRQKGERAAEIVELPLPSGMVIKARRPGPLQFAQWDKLPLILSAFDGRGNELTSEESLETAAFMRELLVYCCVEPRISLEPEAGAILPREIPEADWQFLVAWGMRLKEAATLRSFRPQRPDGDSGGDSEAVFVETVEHDGDRGSDAGTGLRCGGVGSVREGE